ncbi:MAG: hypothetical protein ACT4PU_06470 [Planctomycetota bacterium]
MADLPSGRLAPLRWLLLLVLVAAAVAQAGPFAKRFGTLHEHAENVDTLLRGPLRGVDPALSQVLAWRELPGVAARIPDTARVLLVSGTPLPAQFHFFFLPRPFMFLQPLDPRHLERAIEMAPHFADNFRLQFEILERAGLRLTPERLDEELARADYVVRFLHPGDLPASVELEPVFKGPIVSLDRVRR